MKPLIHPVPLLGLAIAVVGGIMGSIPTVILGLIAGIAAVGFLTARSVQGTRQELPGVDLRPEARVLLKPVRQEADAIEALVLANRNSQALQVVGAEALDAARQLLRHSASVATAWDDLRKLTRGAPDAQAEIRGLERQLSTAKSDAEREALVTALQARQRESSSYAEVAGKMEQIETQLVSAGAYLAELRSRLQATVAGERVEGGEVEALRDALGRASAINSGFEEIEQVIRG